MHNYLYFSIELLDSLWYVHSFILFNFILIHRTVGFSFIVMSPLLSGHNPMDSCLMLHHIIALAVSLPTNITGVLVAP